MRWIFLCSALLLSSCLYTEGQVIDMPEDVVVGDISRFAYWERQATIDVTEPAPKQPAHKNCASQKIR